MSSRIPCTPIPSYLRCVFQKLCGDCRNLVVWCVLQKALIGVRGILWAFGRYSQIFHGRLDIGVLMGSGHQQQRRIILWILLQYFLRTRTSQWIKDRQMSDGGNSQSPRIFQSQFYCVYCSVPVWPPSATVSRRWSSLFGICLLRYGKVLPLNENETLK